ncbi:tetratricopeptide repeat-containing sensor histidine kinase [Flammeovirga agarivorans]|uniref:histidine kinase n=1 Tax=Flammeovirga agarivorans TaxID=2726742 RepID=A0A7X8SI58_9BACT|nr:ATP-binding protein [Flammeovirga agarivorans]NLR90671.1 tetratricopeptide repeat protein [Flammeovirga agarivorans]
MKIYITLSIFLLVIFSSPSFSQQAKIDSLKEEIEKQKGNKLYKTYINLVWESRDLYPDTAVVYGELLLKITEDNPKFRERAKVLNLIGVAIRNKGDYGTAFDYFKQAMLQADINNDLQQKGYSYINIGTLFQFEGDHFEALKNLNEASKIADQLQDNEMIGYCNEMIGKIQLSRGKYDLALMHFQKMLENRLLDNNLQKIAGAHLNIGEAYLAAGDPYLARQEFLKVFDLAQKTDYQSLKHTVEALIGETYYNSSQDSLGIVLKYYGDAYKGFIDLQQPLRQARVLGKIAKVYLDQNRISKSIEAANKGLEIAEQLPALQEALILTDILAKAYKKRGDVQNEAIVLRKYIYYVHLYQDEEKLQRAQMLENTMAIAEKEEEINKLSKQNDLSQEKIDNREYALIFLSVVFLLLGIILFLLNQKTKRFKEFSETLKSKTKEIQDQKFIIGEKVVEVLELNEKLTEKNKELEDNLIQTKKIHEQLVRSEKLAIVGQMMAVVAHEINNPINFIINNIIPITENMMEVKTLVKEQEFENKEELLEDVEESILLLQGIDDGVNRIREISQDLKNAVKSNHGVPQEFNVNDSINTTLNLLTKKYKYDDIDVTLELDEKLPNIICLGGKISQVFINIIDNAFQALKEQNLENKFIKISTKKLKDNKVGISVSDNGGGIKDVDHLFEAFYTTKKEGLGLGLVISKDIIVSHKGLINAFNNKEGGATFTIQLPLSSD